MGILIYLEHRMVYYRVVTAAQKTENHEKNTHSFNIIVLLINIKTIF